MREDQTNLITLVALLVSTAGFKDELSSIHLGNTSFTMFSVFLIATIAFGCLLYIHLIINSYVLFLKAFRSKSRVLYVILLRAVSLLILITLPVLTIYMACSNWLTTQVCKESASIDSLSLIGSNDKTEVICQTPLLSTAIPLFAAAFTVGVVFWFTRRREREFNQLSLDQKKIIMSIQEYRMLQAVSSDIDRINDLQLRIDELKKKYEALSVSKPEQKQSDRHINNK